MLRSPAPTVQRRRGRCKHISRCDWPAVKASRGPSRQRHSLWAPPEEAPTTTPVLRGLTPPARLILDHEITNRSRITVHEETGMSEPWQLRVYDSHQLVYTAEL